MNAPKSFVRIVNKTRYDVKKATLIADDAWWDGHNFERNGTNTFLYKTERNNYFTVTLTQWQGARDALDPQSLEDAIDLFENVLTDHKVKYAEAFPGVEIKDA